MPVWRCPHCAAPQPEAARCWVCRRSTTSCATCRHFRRGVAGGLGMCGLDPRRTALDGTEMRACWVAAPAAPEQANRRLAAVGPGRPEPAAPGRTFVPVETAGPDGAAPRGEPAGRLPDDAPAHVSALASSAVLAAAPARPQAAAGARRIPGAWWLWGDPEPWPEP